MAKTIPAGLYMKHKCTCCTHTRHGFSQMPRSLALALAFGHLGLGLGAPWPCPPIDIIIYSNGNACLVLIKSGPDPTRMKFQA